MKITISDYIDEDKWENEFFTNDGLIPLQEYVESLANSFIDGNIFDCECFLTELLEYLEMEKEFKDHITKKETNILIFNSNKHKIVDKERF